MKKLLLATAATGLFAGAAAADEMKLGILFSFTGPIESITPAMAASAELAIAEANASGLFLGGTTISTVQGDATCSDTAVATATAERMVTSDGVSAIIGSDCSGASRSVLENVAMVHGVPMISPASTNPAFTTMDTRGLFFRTAPSDARQGELLAEVILARGITNVAVTYTNVDYGIGLAESFVNNFTAKGGTVAVNQPHTDGRGDYSSEIGVLAATGADALVVLGYADQGGVMVTQGSVESGAFDTFVFGDGMYADSVLETVGSALNGSFGVVPWSVGSGSEIFAELATAAGINPGTIYTRESYDAAALLILAAQAAGSTDPGAIAENVLRVANAPGEPILPGELGRALEILAAGGEVDYVGATNVELINFGEASGTYREYTITDGAFVEDRIH